MPCFGTLQDEVTQICPVPLPLWMADSAGKGIVIVAVCHGLAQLEARWDKPGARAIWDTEIGRAHV